MLEAAAHRQGSTSAVRRHAGRSPVAPTATAPKILCVDDHASLLASLKRAFEQLGWRADTAENAEAALLVLRRESFDAVIGDLLLPGMSGLDMIKALILEGIETPALIYTGFPEPATEAEALALGIPYVSKHEMPGVRELAPIVLDAIDRHRALRESRVEQVARLLTTTALGLTSADMLGSGWRAEVTARIVRAMVDAVLPFASFLTLVETLRVLHDEETDPASASAFMRLQANRCRKRGELARSMRLDLIVADVDRTAASRHNDALMDSSRVRWTSKLRAMGWSYTDVVRGIVLRRAVALLAHTHEQVAQIAYQLGFEHPATFNRFFKQLLGFAPSELRHFVHGK